MGVVSAKSIEAAIKQAQNVGFVTSTFTLGNCEVVLRNLRPDEFKAILDEIQEYENLEFVNNHQLCHVARSIVGFNGVDFSDVEYIEVEESDPKSPNQTLKVKLELHEYIKKHILSTWSKEAIFTAYRKFGDVVKMAEDKAKEDITFLIPDETPEEQYRRLMQEAKELEDDVPPGVIKSVLEEYGYSAQSTQVELSAAADRLKQLKVEQEAAPQGTKQSAPVAPQETVQPPVPQPSVTRVPVHQQVISSQVPAAPVEDPHLTASRQVIQAAPGSRSAELAALEMDADPSLQTELKGSVHGIQAHQIPGREGVAEVGGSPRAHDQPAASLAGMIDRPPTGGLNPRYKPPVR